jgi:subtilisin-like proprotein convertase family protein
MGRQSALFHKNQELDMRSFLCPMALALAGFFLSGCGGAGGSSSATVETPKANAPEKISFTCDSNTLWANLALSSGTNIPDNNTAGSAVTWDNQNCPIQSLTSATIEICLNHSLISDLVWTIKAPSAANPVTFAVPANWNTGGASCAAGTGRLQSIDLLPVLIVNASTRGPWTLQVSDRTLGNTGALMQWRILLKGTN